MLSQAYVKAVLDYDPATGVLTWRHRPRAMFKSDGSYKSWNTRFAGRVAGRPHKTRGYVEVKLLGGMRKAHRLIFLWLRGYVPEMVDHESGARALNAETNLRPANHAINGKNQRRPSTNKSGVSGVNWHRRDEKWRAYIKVGARNVSLGYFTDFDAAVAARKAAEQEHGYHPNHGRPHAT